MADQPTCENCLSCRPAAAVAAWFTTKAPFVCTAMPTWVGIRSLSWFCEAHYQRRFPDDFSKRKPHKGDNGE